METKSNQTIDVTIAATESLSTQADLEGFSVVAIEMPAAWTAAAITVQAASLRDGTFKDVVDDGGTEVSITAAASQVIAVSAAKDALAPLRFIKLRSGTGALPVAQAAERVIRLICKAT